MQERLSFYDVSHSSLSALPLTADLIPHFDIDRTKAGGDLHVDI